MAKLGKLTKLKSAIKKWPSLKKLSCNNNNVSSHSVAYSKERDQDLHVVYVGKSRRRYVVNSEVINHRLFQELVDNDDGAMVISCEVVLFEHLLWMLENTNVETQLESMDELVEFYSCVEC